MRTENVDDGRRKIEPNKEVIEESLGESVDRITEGVQLEIDDLKMTLERVGDELRVVSERLNDLTQPSHGVTREIAVIVVVAVLHVGVIEIVKWLVA